MLVSKISTTILSSLLLLNPVFSSPTPAKSLLLPFENKTESDDGYLSAKSGFSMRRGNDREIIDDIGDVYALVIYLLVDIAGRDIDGFDPPANFSDSKRPSAYITTGDATLTPSVTVERRLLLFGLFSVVNSFRVDRLYKFCDFELFLDNQPMGLIKLNKSPDDPDPKSKNNDSILERVIIPAAEALPFESQDLLPAPRLEDLHIENSTSKQDAIIDFSTSFNASAPIELTEILLNMATAVLWMAPFSTNALVTQKRLRAEKVNSIIGFYRYDTVRALPFRYADLGAALRHTIDRIIDYRSNEAFVTVAIWSGLMERMPLGAVFMDRIDIDLQEEHRGFPAVPGFGAGGSGVQIS